MTPAPIFPFIVQLGQTCALLADLFQDAFVPGSRLSASHMGFAMKQLVHLHNEGKQVDRDIGLLRLQFLAKHLREVRDFNRSAFESYRQRLLATDHYLYYGTRAEVWMASALARRTVPFTTPDPPDFLVQHGGHEIWVECTSVHIRSSTRRNLVYKIESAMRSKRTDLKRVALAERRPTVLVIDITALAYEASLREGIVDEQARAATRQLCEPGLVDAVLLVCVGASPTEIRYNYTRIEHGLAEGRAVAFLNDLFPFGEPPPDPMHVLSMP